MDKKAKYKVGDLVCCIGNEMILHEDTDEDVTDLEWGGYGHELGRSFIIHEIAIADEFHRIVYWDKEDNVGVYENHLKLANKKDCGVCKYRLQCITK